MTSYISMFSKSVLAITLAAAAVGAYARSAAGINPHTAAIQRFNTVVKNPNLNFRDIQVAGRVYTVQPHTSLIVTAPAGTSIYSADNMSHHHTKGSLLAQVTPKDQTITLE